MDILIAILLASVQALLAFLGGLVSLKKFSEKARRHFVWAFVALAGVGIALTAWQAVWAKKSSEDSARNALGDAEHPPSVTEISLPNFTRFVVSNTSNYPAYGIRIRLYDDTSLTGPPIIVRNYIYAEIPAHAALMDDYAWNPPDTATQRHFSADITTRTGVYREELIMRQSGNQWMRALRVMQGMRQLDDDIDSAWPREPNGDIQWVR